MKNIPIKNTEILGALNNFLWYYDNREFVEKNLLPNGDNQSEVERRSHWVSDVYRDEVIAMDEKHEGFPDSTYSYGLKADRLVFKNSKSPEAFGFVSRYAEYNEKLCSLLCTRNNALTVLYPPDGYISWHNNANASAYNLIFTWSETGEGYFKYVDGHTGEEVVMQDKKGWQCKAGYFGAYGEPWYNRVYHAAKTDCWRLTVSYMFDRTDMSMSLHEDIMEEIMSDF